MIFDVPPAHFRHGLCVSTLILQIPDHRVLLVRNIEKKGGYWSTVGGKCKQNEPPKRGGMRETREEIGVEITDEETLVPLTPTSEGLYVVYRNGLHFNFHSFLVRVPDPPKIVLNPKELVEAGWFSLEELNTLPFIEDGAAFIQRPEVMTKLTSPWPHLKTL